MDTLIPLLAMAALFAGWWWFLHRSSDGRWWSPLWTSFSIGALAIVLMVAGMAGYALGRQEWLTDGARSGRVIWWQVGAGLALVPLAVFLWRKGLRSLVSTSEDRSHRKP